MLPKRTLTLLLLLGAELAFYNPSFAQDYSKFARCNEASQQQILAASSLSRQDREKLLYDLYIDSMSLLKEKSNRDSNFPRGLRDNCIKSKWKSYMTALNNGDATFKRSFKLRWQTAELQEARGEFGDALNSYLEAAKLEPDNAEVQMKYFKVWDLHTRRSLRLDNQKVNSAEVQRYIEESEKKLKMISSIPDATRETKVEALTARCDLYPELAKLFTSPEKIQRCFEDLLQHDPNNEKALRYLADYYLKKQLNTQATNYLARLESLGVASSSDRSVTFSVLLGQRNFKALLDLADSVIRRKPKDKEALEYRAIALHELGRKSELRTAVQTLRAVNPRSVFLQEVDALKLEETGDQHSSRGLPSNALASYQSATKLLGADNHNLYRIQGKIARIIFEHHEAQNFKNPEAVRVDMKEVVKLLSPVLKESNPDPKILRTSIKAASLGQMPDVGEKLCDRLFDKFANLNNKAEVLLCADLLISGGKKSKAAELLNQSSRKAQYSKDELEAEKKKRQL